MILTLYKNQDGDNVLNKTLVNGYDLTIWLKAETDVTRPRIVLSTVEGVNFNDFNYAYIAELNRYYYLDSVANMNARLWRLDLSCDVIESYKADILASSARLRRNIRNGDYMSTAIDSSVIKSVSLHNSDKGFTGADNSLILTTLGA